MTNLNNPFRRCRHHLESDPRGGQQLGGFGGWNGSWWKMGRDMPRYARFNSKLLLWLNFSEDSSRYFLLSCQRPQVVHVLQSRNDRQWSAAEFNRRMNHGRKKSARIAPLVRCMASLGAEDWHCPKKGHNSAQAPELVLRPVFFALDLFFASFFDLFFANQNEWGQIHSNTMLWFHLHCCPLVNSVVCLPMLEFDAECLLGAVRSRFDGRHVPSH